MLWDQECLSDNQGEGRAFRSHDTKERRQLVRRHVRVVRQAIQVRPIYVRVMRVR